MVVKQKPKYKTTEFWLSITVMVIGLLFSSGIVQPGTSIDKGLGCILTLLSSLGYTYNRTKIKNNADKPGYKTSEFWFNAVAMVNGAVISSGAVEGGEMDKILSGLSAGMTAMGYSPLRANLKASLKVVPFFLLVGCCGPTKAELMTYHAVAPEYIKYVKEDSDLTDVQKARRERTIKAWKLRLDKTGE